MTRSRVAAVWAAPETVLADLARLCEMAGMPDALQPGVIMLREAQ